MILGSWWLATRLGWARLPSPEAVTGALIGLAEHGGLVEHAAVSVQRLGVGFVAGAAAGIIAFRLTARVPAAREPISSAGMRLLDAKPLPWLVIIVVAIGAGDPTVIIAVGVVAAIAVFARTATTEPTGSGRSPLRVALSRSWVVVIAAELIRSHDGLGSLVRQAGFQGHVAEALAALVVIAALTRLSDLLLVILEWPPSTAPTRRRRSRRPRAAAADSVRRT